MIIDAGGDALPDEGGETVVVEAVVEEKCTVELLAFEGPPEFRLLLERSFPPAGKVAKVTEPFSTFSAFSIFSLLSVLMMLTLLPRSLIDMLPRLSPVLLLSPERLSSDVVGEEAPDLEAFSCCFVLDENGE